MANHVEIKLTGFDVLQAKLRELGPKVTKNGLRSATYAGAKITLDAVKRAAPVRTGLLRANLRAVRRRTPETTAMYTIGIRTGVMKYGNTSLNRRLRRVGKKYKVDGPAFYGRFQEFGSSKQAAKPFARPAAEQNTGNVIDAIREGLAKAIARAIK